MKDTNKEAFLVSAYTLAQRIANVVDFVEGYTSYMKGLPYNYDTDGWSYPRGRQFAVYCKTFRLPRAVWRKDGAAKTLIARIADSFRYGFVR